MIGLGLRITSGAAHNALPGIAAPVFTLTGGAVDAPLQPQLNTSAFTLENGAVDTHASTDWQIATDAAFTNIVWSALASASLTQITVGLALSETTTYYARARHNGATYQSKYSAGVTFNTLSVFVTTPAITSPAAAATGIGDAPAITSSAFAVTNGSDTHASTDWQVASDAGFATIVAQSLTDTANKTSWTVPAGNLLVNTGYFVRVRHTGTAQGPSAWSPIIGFTTKATFSTPWDISTASYASKAFLATAQDTDLRDVVFDPTGTKMYLIGFATDTVYQYTLSTAWDVSTASTANKSASIGAQETIPTGMIFSADGTKMYVVGNANDTIYQYTLSTAWDVSTASYTSKLFSVSTQETSPSDVVFSADGTKMYVTGFTTDKVYQYTLTTAWDVSSAAYASKSLSVGPQENIPLCVVFSADGTKMYVAGQQKGTVYRYNLTTAWDISTASYASQSFSVSAQETIPTGIAFKPDGTKMYIIGQANDTVYQFSL